MDAAGSNPRTNHAARSAPRIVRQWRSTPSPVTRQIRHGLPQLALAPTVKEPLNARAVR